MCQFENPDDVNFCVKCGGKLEKICPKCGCSNSLSHKFCGGCGYKLSLPVEALPKDLSFDEKLTKIRRYLPKGLTEKILSQKDRIEGERKQVTVMFADMEGFTQLSEILGPEETYTVMDQVYEVLIRKVHDYEGTVNELTGDGIMALFGAPRALEDAPQRAIRSAQAIHREMARIRDRMDQDQQDIKPLKMRIGIHTGSVVVGSLGSDLRVEFKAVGDTVNLASRMEGLAKPGSTYVSEETFKLSEGFFRFESLGDKTVKGKKDPIKVYRVIAPSSRRTRFDVSAEQGLTPLVGRERELELLLDSYEMARRDNGNAISIVSNAGVGKSRLLYEFRKAVANENIIFLEGKCLSYSRGEMYHPVNDILKSLFDLHENDKASAIRGKIEDGLKVLQVDTASTLPYILELLSVKNSGIDQIVLSPEAKKENIIAAISRLVIKGSEVRPLIMAIEDLHWIDKSSEELSKYLLRSIVGAKVLLIFTYRPEYIPSWHTKSYHSQINLNRLSNQQSIEMVSSLLGSKNLDSELEKLIIKKTEGVPFYIEEFLKSLQYFKIIIEDKNKYTLSDNIEILSVPETIQDVIMARVDGLSDSAKSLLQIGSVIEREFSYELIRKISGLDEQELKSNLSIIIDSELLYSRGIYPNETYIFKHALIQEVVYNSILMKKRIMLHGIIGDALEDLKKKDIDEYYGILAKHYSEGKRYEKGAEYSRLAAKKSMRAASFIEAIGHTKRCVSCLEKLQDTVENSKKIIDARTILANYYLTLTYVNEAKQTIDVIVDKAHQINYRKRLPRIYTVIGIYNLWVKEDFAQGYRYLIDAVKISEEVADFLSLYFANFYLGWTLSFNCDFQKAEKHLNKALDLSALGNNLIGISFAKGVMSTATYNFNGKVEQAYDTGQDLLKMLEESTDIFIKGMAYSSFGTSCHYKGYFEQAEENLLKGITFSEKTTQAGWKAWTCFYLGENYINKKNYMKAQEYYREGTETLEFVNVVPSAVCMFEVSLARARVLNNDKDIILTELFENFKNNKLNALEGWIARYIGEILLNIDSQQLSEAEKWTNRAIEANEKYKMNWSLGHDFVLLSRISNIKEDKLGAKDELSKALKIFKDCGADGWVEKYKKELATL
jgi:class 3 adenylate cyclase/tetratricopeptide (TPR) repeat protein